MMYIGPKAVARANVIDPLTAFQMFLGPIELIILNMENLYGVRKYKDQWQNIDLITCMHILVCCCLLAYIVRIWNV